MTWERQTMNMSLGSLYRYYKDKLLDLHPEFQRDAVWSQKLERELIKSILQNFDIGKVFLFPKTFKVGKNTKPGYAVLDGQQRLHTVFRFFEDQFRLNKPANRNMSTKHEWERLTIDGQVVAGLAYSQLPEDIRARVEGYLLDVTVIKASDQDLLVQQFVGLQRGKPLTEQATREAYPSILNRSIRDMEKQFIAENALAPRMNLNKSRTATGYFRQTLAYLYACEQAGAFTEARASALDKVYLESSWEITSDQEVVSVIGNVYEVLEAAGAAFKHVTCPISLTFFVTMYWIIRQQLIDKCEPVKNAKKISAWYDQFYKEQLKPAPDRRSIFSGAGGGAGKKNLNKIRFELSYENLLAYLASKDGRK